MGAIVGEVRGFTPLLDALVEELGLVAAAVYGVVWRYTRMHDGVCTASLETIAARAGVDRRTALRHIKGLCAAGYLRDLTPSERARPHTYADTGKARIAATVAAEVGVTESHSSGAGGVTESHSGSDTESLPGVTQSHPKILSKRLSKIRGEETSEDTHGAGAPRVDNAGEIVAELARHFSAATGIAQPRPRTDRQRRAAEALWVEPLAKIAQLGGSAAGGRELIDEAVRRLRDRGCIIKGPISLVGTATAVAGEARARRDRWRRQAERYGHLVET